MTMLLQRHVNLIDAQNRVHLTDARVAETISFYAQLVAGPRRIAAEAGTGTGLWVNDLREGNLCAAIAPDWRLELLKKFAPDLSGKMRVMPLPKFDPSDAPASTWSGTMIGIPRQCKNPDLAWKLIEFYYLSPAALDARIQKSGILPPLPEAWSGPVYGQADPFFGGRRIYAMYAQLATQVPPRNTSFATPYAQSTLGVVMSYAVSYVRRHGGADGLPAYVQGLLTIAQRDLERRIDKLSFTQE
jgi:ABC-type glycerol-3-phosphate transport system substrate-binding protein